MTKIASRRFRILASLAGALLMLMAVGAGGVRAAEGDSAKFKYFKMEFPGTHHDRVIIDVNGDGKKDINLIISRSDQRDAWWLKTCLQDAAGGFSGKCVDLKLAAKVRAFDLGEFDGQPGADLVLLTDSGVEAAHFLQGKFSEAKPASADKSIFAGTVAGRPMLLNCLRDLNADKKDELILPTMSGPVVYRHDAADGGFAVFQKISSPPHISYRVGSLGDITATDDVNQFLRFREYEKRVTAFYTVPDVFVEDFNGDKKLDLITLVDNTLKVFPQGADGRFAEKPAVNFKKSILPAEEKGVGFAGEAMTYADLNGDGLGDIIMMKWGSSQERTQMDRFLYYARPGLKYPNDPDQIIRSESAAVDFGIMDLNNDKKNDLIIPYFHFAPAQAFKVITENSIKVQFRIFLMQAAGRYSQEEGKTFAKVDRRVLVNYKIDVLGMIFDFKSMLEGKFHPLISFGHDFNGDGFGDLIADTGGDKLTFFWGNKDVNYAAQPDFVLDFESAMNYDLADINGDGKTDVITYYESAARTQKKREIAKKARESGQSSPGEYELTEGAAIAKIPEGTRVKVLIAK